MPNWKVTTRGRSGICDSMNCPDEMTWAASELVRLLPVICAVQLSLVTPIAASKVVYPGMR